MLYPANSAESYNLTESVEQLSPGQVLHVPAGHYNANHCGVNVLANNVTISGYPGSVVINCSGSDRHFVVSGHNVVLEGLTLLHGSSSHVLCNESHLSCPASLDGGSVLALGQNLTIKDCAIRHCLASEHGGAVSVRTPGAVTRLHGVEISDCGASRGGAVWALGPVVAENCTLRGNTAMLDGGAVMLQGPGVSLIMGRTECSGNVALRNGGCVALLAQSDPVVECCTGRTDGGLVTLSDGTVLRSNAAALRGGGVYIQDGGGLQAFGGPEGVALSLNSAKYGGAVAVRSFSEYDVAGNVTVSGNSAALNGAGFNMGCCSAGRLWGAATVEGNVAGGPGVMAVGGGFYMPSDCELHLAGDVRVLSNQAMGGWGGAVYVQLGSTLWAGDRVSIAGNSAVMGGALSLLFGSWGFVDGDVRLEGNGAVYGGAATFQGSELRVGGRAVMADNTGDWTYGYGGAVYMDGATLRLADDAQVPRGARRGAARRGGRGPAGPARGLAFWAGGRAREAVARRERDVGRGRGNRH